MTSNNVTEGDDGTDGDCDPGGAAAELPQEPPGLEYGHGTFAEAANLGVIAVVVSTPAAEVLATDRDKDRRAGALVRLVGPALDVVGGEGGGYAVVPGRGQVVCGSRQCIRGPDQAPGGIGEVCPFVPWCFFFSE